jgi:DNA-binding NtrC family response regulator
MTKVEPKSARVASVSQGHVLYCESDVSVLASQSKVFERAGYTVELAQGRVLAERALRKGTYDIVILGHTLTRDDRHHLPYMAKKFNGATQVVVLHNSGKHPAVDVALDSRDGEKAVLAALASLAGQKLSVAS